MATKSMLTDNVSQSMRKARSIDGFLMFDATKSQVFKKRSGKSRRFRRRSYNKYYQRNWASSIMS